MGHEIEERVLLKKRYSLAVELVELLKQHGFWIRLACPRCGAEGTLSTLATPNGYVYLVVRHPSKNTHTIPKKRVGEVMCKIEQDLERILEIYEKYVSGVNFCNTAEAK
jgi:hypothetical protein